MEEKCGEEKEKEEFFKNDGEKNNLNLGRIFTPGFASSSPTHAKVTRESFRKMSYDKMRTRTLVKERLGLHWSTLDVIF